ncbi:macrophage mannose receptor 1-like [Tachysurus fulvidraco]|uniref:macrophage mannose receptor 1-like n=1 Tax=Tachysurus fulvidraco TaxID=1234273 RepID=UPI001FEF2A38|nr:macrophage mannose receptor 1-like [Tachysurus fulvidraco]
MRAMFHLLLLLGFCTTGICSSRQFHLINENKTWAEAQRYCRENYVDLASIDNAKEELALINMTDIRNSTKTWLGLYDDLNSWKWSLDDDSFYKDGEKSFRNWYIVKPSNWNGKRRINASERYILVNEFMNWTEAQRYCREHHTDLASVRSEAEDQKIRLLYNTYYFYNSLWIGLYRTRSWSDRSNSSFSYWKPGQPDNSDQNEYCTAVSFNITDSGKWTDENCNKTIPFFCYTMSSTSSRVYYFVTENKTWTEAQRYCRENYTDLATIENMAEMNELLNAVNNSYSDLAWIGLYDDPDSWRWSLDDEGFYSEGEKVFTGWYHEPNNYNGKELCVFIRSDGKWADGDCNNDMTFICYDGEKISKTWVG